MTKWLMLVLLTLCGSMAMAQDESDLMDDYYAQMYLYGEYVEPVDAPPPLMEPMPLVVECDAETALANAKAQASATRLMADGQRANAAVSEAWASTYNDLPSTVARFDAMLLDLTYTNEDLEQARIVMADAAYDYVDMLTAYGAARDEYREGLRLWDGAELAFGTGTVESYERANRVYFLAMPRLSLANDYFAQGDAFRREYRRKYDLMIPGAWMTMP